MNNQLVKNSQKTLKVLDKFFDKEDVWNQIAVRNCTDDKDLFQLQTFNKDSLQVIAQNMKEVDRATRTLGRKNSQTTNKLMTLTMLSGSSSYKVLSQCLAQIESKRNALKETRFKLKKSLVELAANIKKVEFYQEQLDSSESVSGLDKIELEEKVELLKIDIEEKRVQISGTVLYIEGALKDIASFQSSYLQVCKNKNIPMNWDEKDLEQAEVLHHVRMGFLLAYRDIKAHSNLGMGTLEYVHQFGILPDLVESEVRYFINEIPNQTSDYSTLEDWLDQMSFKYKDNYLDALKRIGLDKLFDQDFMYIEKDK